MYFQAIVAQLHPIDVSESVVVVHMNELTTLVEMVVWFVADVAKRRVCGDECGSTSGLRWSP